MAIISWLGGYIFLTFAGARLFSLFLGFKTIFKYMSWRRERRKVGYVWPMSKSQSKEHCAYFPSKLLWPAVLAKVAVSLFCLLFEHLAMSPCQSIHGGKSI